MPKIILTRGIQGSGKSTWAKKWVEEEPTHRVRWNNDDFRKMLGPYWIPEREELIPRIMKEAIDEEVRLKKSDSMTQAEYDREVAFADWYHQNGKGTPTYSDAIEWTRRELIDKACEIVRNIINEYFGDGEQSCKVEDTFRKAMKE